MLFLFIGGAVVAQEQIQWEWKGLPTSQRDVTVTSQCDVSVTSQCDISVTSQCDVSVTSQCDVTVTSHFDQFVTTLLAHSDLTGVSQYELTL